MLTALLVDDEPRSSARLTELLGACGGEIEVIGVARSVADARLFLSGRRPDVVFLDFSMPGGPGVELLPDVGPETQVVFVTATEVAAVAAFEHGVVDYLLKPISQPRLERAVERLQRACFGREADAQGADVAVAAGAACQDTGSRPSLEAVSLGSKMPLVNVGTQRVEMVSVADISWITAEKNDTHVQAAASQPVTVRRKIGEWEAMLPADTFQRLDRSLIVNLQRLSTTQTRSREQTLLSFEGVDAPLPIGRTAATRLKEALRV
jgi:two-component system LytT family response regulator